MKQEAKTATTTTTTTTTKHGGQFMSLSTDRWSLGVKCLAIMRAQRRHAWTGQYLQRKFPPRGNLVSLIAFYWEQILKLPGHGDKAMFHPRRMYI